MSRILNTQTGQLLDTMNTGIVLVGSGLYIRHMNTAAESMLGISRTMANDRNIFETFPSMTRINKQLMMAWDNQQIYFGRDMEIVMEKPHRIIIDCVISPKISDDLSTKYLMIELYQVDRRLRIYREDHLLSQGESTRELLRGVAHEVKNPLGGIRGAAQLLAGELPDSQYTSYTDVIIHEVDRLQSLLDRMLGPRQLPRLEKVNIHQVLEQVRMLAEVDNEYSIRVVADYDPSLPELDADTGMLQQALLNLVRNAIQASTGEDQVVLRTRPERQFTIGHVKHRLLIRVEIIDNGNGIPEDMVETMFLPLVTGRKDGSGLGLAIAQNLVQRHDGLIEYERCDGKTCFIVYLPTGRKNDTGK